MSKLFECYVANPSYDEAVEIVERLIANGAKVFDSIYGMGVGGKEDVYDKYNCWGYHSGSGTYTYDRYSPLATSAKRLTMQEFRDAFPYEKYDGVTKEWPQPGDKVVVKTHGGDLSAIFIGKSTFGSYVCQMPKDYQYGVYDGFGKGVLSKPKSDREKFIEAALNAAIKAKPESDAKFAGALYDAGFKAPEDK